MCDRLAVLGNKIARLFADKTTKRCALDSIPAFAPAWRNFVFVIAQQML